jgi:hypothetical protein
MPDEYLPPNKILFVQNLPESVTKEQLSNLFNQCGPFRPCCTLCCLIVFVARYPNLYEVRLIPTKKDIAFVEYVDENSSTAAKDALHNYKIDGENKIKVRSPRHLHHEPRALTALSPDHVRAENMTGSDAWVSVLLSRLPNCMLYHRCFQSALGELRMVAKAHSLADLDALTPVARSSRTSFYACEHSQLLSLNHIR